MLLKIRKIIFWLHLAVGVVVGLFILNLAASGIVMGFQRQIIARAEQAQRTVPVPSGGQRLDAETLIRRTQEARPSARISGLMFYANPESAAMFTTGRDSVIYVDPYSGEIRGEGKPALRRFFSWVNSWHRWLALEGPAKGVGQAITGAASLGYFILLLSGLLIWIPKKSSKKAFRDRWRLNWKFTGKARDWNWHNVTGLWVSPLLLLVTLTAIIMSYSWANALLFRAAGSPLPEARRGAREEGPRAGTPVSLDGLNALWSVAERQVPGWKTISLVLSSNAQAPVRFTIDSGDGGRPDLRSQLTLRRDTGEIMSYQPFEKESTGRQWRSWVRFTHTGEAAGLFGQTLAVVAALGGMVLVWTGLALAWRRFFARPSQGSAASVSPQHNTPHTPL